MHVILSAVTIFLMPFIITNWLVRFHLKELWGTNFSTWSEKIMIMLFTWTSFGEYAHTNATLIFYKLVSDVCMKYNFMLPSVIILGFALLYLVSNKYVSFHINNVFNHFYIQFFFHINDKYWNMALCLFDLWFLRSLASRQVYMGGYILREYGTCIIFHYLNKSRVSLENPIILLINIRNITGEIILLVNIKKNIMGKG